MIDLLVLGAGASGYAAAIQGARMGAKVVLADAQPKVCRKVLASGNGRCNLTARTVDVTQYATHAPRQLQTYLDAVPSALPFLQSLGIEVHYDAQGRAYPLSNRATSVADALALHAAHSGVRLQTGFAVAELRSQGSAGCTVLSATGDSLYAPRVVVALGSPAAPQLGANDTGLQLARALGLRVWPFAPALVPVAVTKPLVSLKGCRVECAVSLVGQQGVVMCQQGEVLFADYGLSGIAVMQLSAYLDRGDTISLDLMPAHSSADLQSLLFARAREGAYPTVDKWLVGWLDRPVAYAVLKAAGISPLDSATARWDASAVRRLAATLKDWRFAVQGPLGLDHAQVCTGGVGLDELQLTRSRRHPATFWCGEVVDVTGLCGGYNLHWAWISGQLAAQQALGAR